MCQLAHSPSPPPLTYILILLIPPNTIMLWKQYRINTVEPTEKDSNAAQYDRMGQVET